MEWKDITDVWLYWNDVKSRIIRNVGEKIGLSSGIILQCHITKTLSYEIFIQIAYITCKNVAGMNIKISDFFAHKAFTVQPLHEKPRKQILCHLTADILIASK